MVSDTPAPSTTTATAATPTTTAPSTGSATATTTGSGATAAAYWRVDGTTLVVRGQVEDGTWTVDEYVVHEDDGERLELPFGLRPGMARQDVLDAMPRAEERRDLAVPDRPAWLTQDDVHVFLTGPDTDAGLAGPGTEVAAVQFGPLHCMDGVEEIPLGGSSLLGQELPAPADDLLPVLTRALGQGTPEAVVLGPCGDAVRFVYEPGLSVVVATDGRGERMVDSWHVGSEDPRLVLPDGLRLGMTLEEARQQLGDPDAGGPDAAPVTVVEGDGYRAVFTDGGGGTGPTGETLRLSEMSSVPVLCRD